MILNQSNPFLILNTKSFKLRGKPTYNLSWVINITILLTLFYLNTLNAFPLRFTDEVGREVILNFPPKRIVSLAPNITEILYALGIEEEIVGVTVHCNYPEKVKEKPKVGSFINIDFERLITLKPDLILATAVGNTREMVDRLDKLGYPIYVIFPKNIQDIMQSILNIGHIVNREKEAYVMINEMKLRLNRVLERTKGLARPKVFLQIGEAPIVTVGKGSFGDDLIRLSGGENIAGKEEQRYPRLSMEEIVKRSPEVIIISSMNPKGDYKKILYEWSRWKIIPAIKNNRIHLINSDLIDRPSPRIIEALEVISRIIHPSAFDR
jgi:iron complex transport system substrate-binding protein